MDTGAAMDAKADAITKKLSAEMGCQIDYRRENSLHKFRMECDPPHWLYMSEEHFEDCAERDLTSEIDQLGIVRSLLESTKSRWIAITDAGPLDVDSKYGHGH